MYNGWYNWMILPHKKVEHNKIAHNLTLMESNTYYFTINTKETFYNHYNKLRLKS